VAVLHFVPEGAQEIVSAFTGRMPPGSYLALSHVTSDGADPGVVAAIEAAYAGATAPAVFRSRPDIDGFFAGLDLAGPGLADVTRWSPYGPALAGQSAGLGFLAGVARKP
jgi:hypothetical protein